MGKVVGRGPAVCAAVFERLSGELQRQRDAAAAHDWPAFLEADRAFHQITLDQSGNRMLSDFYSSLRDRQMRMIGESVIRDAQRMTTIMDEHRVIAEALRDGDLNGARGRGANSPSEHGARPRALRRPDLACGIVVRLFASTGLASA